MQRYARSFAYLRDVWHDFAKLQERSGGEVQLRSTQEHWLLVLLRELGYETIDRQIVR
ncbi:hypothetical protein GCM10027290_38530 [Micromonospora sonneratiae]|uniref:Uncharacterized protein n=1 Tax=Micromonospora sonneratiae TaxID=1184706 RepID=A0ABW3YAP2_9ACTN